MHAGPGRDTACPLGFKRIDQDLNEGDEPHTNYVYLCYSYEVALLLGTACLTMLAELCERRHGCRGHVRLCHVRPHRHVHGA